MVIILYEDDLNLVFMNINEKLDKIAEQLCIPTKLLISQLLIALEYQMWHQMYAETQSFYSVVRYANNCTSILIYNNENIRNNRKVAEKFKEDILTK